MSITASMVKELREKTGAGMMDCKKALQEVEGDLEKAIDCSARRSDPGRPKRPDVPLPMASWV